jgi:hypothetical protein
MNYSFCARNLSAVVTEEQKLMMSEERTEKEEVMECWKKLHNGNCMHYAELILTVYFDF